ncbi:hypothetical protein J437_LFUL017925 [Ladona fulva]|uniref:Ig-like domain-containing protein n=1 Tax=Ladona fulva TaxID=123851 RepID=A0A8K0KMR0_LADFU|nr:hypothetical protein J437_LFUL017925 [Ladona fulva]
MRLQNHDQFAFPGHSLKLITRKVGNSSLVVFMELKRVVNSGESATFNCSVSGSPLDTVRWLANGVPLAGGVEGTSSPRIRLLSPQVLHISSVGRGDRGMYQCVAKNERESAQGSAELRLGGG